MYYTGRPQSPQQAQRLLHPVRRRLLMRFRVSCELEYTAHFPSTLILNVHAQRSASQAVLDERLVIEPRLKVSEFTADSSDNRFIRLNTGRHKKIAVSY